jgi:hypothetical protein
MAMRTLGSLALCGLALAFSATLPACSSVGSAGVSGASGVAYVNGVLDAILEASPQRIVQASEAALKELEIPVVSRDASAVDGKVIGRTALQRKIDITIHRKTETTSELSIRVDTFGDEAYSRQILDKIKSKL